MSGYMGGGRIVSRALVPDRGDAFRLCFLPSCFKAASGLRRYMGPDSPRISRGRGRHSWRRGRSSGPRSTKHTHVQGPGVGCLKTGPHLAYRGEMRGSVFRISCSREPDERTRATRSSFRRGQHHWTHLHQRFPLETRLSATKPRSPKPRGLASNRYPPLRHSTINKDLHADQHCLHPSPCILTCNVRPAPANRHHATYCVARSEKPGQALGATLVYLIAERRRADSGRDANDACIENSGKDRCS